MHYTLVVQVKITIVASSVQLQALRCNSLMRQNLKFGRSKLFQWTCELLILKLRSRKADITCRCDITFTGFSPIFASQMKLVKIVSTSCFPELLLQQFGRTSVSCVHERSSIIGNGVHIWKLQIAWLSLFGFSSRSTVTGKATCYELSELKSTNIKWLFFFLIF